MENQNLTPEINEESGINIKDLFRVALKYKFMILALIVVATVAAFIYVKVFVTVKYRSETCVVVALQSNASKQSASQDNITYDYSNSQKLIDTIADLSKKDLVVNEVVKRWNDEDGTYWATKHPEIDADVLNKIKNYKLTTVIVKEGLSVSSSSNKFFIDLYFDCDNQEICDEILDLIVEVLIDTCNSDTIAMFNDAVTQADYASPAKYHSPSILKAVLIGFAIGLVLSVGLIVILELTRTHFKDSDEVERYLKTTVLGSIYDVDLKKHTRRELAVKSLDLNKNNYNKLISTLDYYQTNEELKVMQVTSSIPSEGKSTIIFNIAREMATLEKKVLLIDLDINRPVQHRMVQLKRTPGFTDYALGHNTLNDIVHHLDEGFDLICSGTKNVNSLIILNGNKLRELLNEIKKLGVYDYILLDTPPVHASADSVTIGKNSDAILYVISEKESKKNLTLDAFKQLKERNYIILGIVLNNVEMKGKKSSYYYYYKYYSKDTTGSEKIEVDDNIDETPVTEEEAKETMKNLDKIDLDNKFLEEDNKKE